MWKQFYIELVVKNVLAISLFFLFLMPQISYEFEVLKAPDQSGVLAMLGFLMAGGIIGAFELSYVKTNLASTAQRYLAHISKFLLLLAITILIWIGYKTIAISGGYFNDWILLAGLLIICALIIYDIWDAVCAAQKQYG